MHAGVREFRSEHGRSPEAAARAPGRVNLIGEHTDYNGGLVLPCAIDLATLALGARRSDRRVAARALDLDASDSFELGAPQQRGTWFDFVQGVCEALLARGCEIGGVDLVVTSDVPREAGLSSSAALGVALATLFDRLFDLGLDARARAEVAHRAETQFVGVACGILDHYASALGRAGHALRIDCLDRSLREIPLPADRAALLIAHSGVTRALAEGAYGRRVAECGAALEGARSAGLVAPDAESLRALDPADLERLAAHVDETPLRRARHVLSENARVDAFASALEAGDLAAAGVLLREGQRSLRDDYEVSVPELDDLCEIADALPGVHGSRLTGAGFGGCTLHLVDPGAVAAVHPALQSGFEARHGRRPPVWLARVGAGARAVDPETLD